VSLALPTREPKTREGRLGGSPSLAAQPGTQFPRGASCDFCRTSLTTDERHRLVWRSTFVSELILADLCGRCATGAQSLVDRYGGHGREAIALVSEARAGPPTHRVPALVARSSLYLLIALTFFLIVTLFSSLTR
jgi:hypothetical protein